MHGVLNINSLFSVKLRGKKFLFTILIVVFLSCAAQNTAPGIRDIVNLWSVIEENPDIESIDINYIDSFYESVIQFQQSDLYRMYNSIPFSPQIKRSIRPLHIGQPISENTGRLALAAGNVSENTLILRACVIAGDLDTAQTAQAEIKSALIHLLEIDAEAQSFIASAYSNLFTTLAVFIVIMILFASLLYRAFTRSLKREGERKTFSHAYMLAQEEERFRISRELHDTVIQDMRCLLLETEKIGSTDEKNERETMLGKTVPMMAELIRKTRNMCNDLVPPDFRFRELPEALRHLCLEVSEKTGINCRAEIDENINLDSLTMEKRLQVFRIVKEALTNIEKHADAKEAIVTMRCDRSHDTSQKIVFIGISDDGKGFTSPLDNNGQIISDIAATLGNNSSLGIISMKERAAILGGKLKIITEPGEGALICLEFPV